MIADANAFMFKKMHMNDHLKIEENLSSTGMESDEEEYLHKLTEKNT
jgi:hypothetical protein